MTTRTLKRNFAGSPPASSRRHMIKSEAVAKTKLLAHQQERMCGGLVTYAIRPDRYLSLIPTALRPSNPSLWDYCIHGAPEAVGVLPGKFLVAARATEQGIPHKNGCGTYG